MKAKAALAIFFVGTGIAFSAAHAAGPALGQVLLSFEDAVPPEVGEKVDAAVRSKWTSEDPYIIRLLETWRENMDFVRQADIAAFFSRKLPPDSPPRVRFPAIRNFARLLLAEGRRHEKNAKFAEALESDLLVLKWADHLTRDNRLVSFMTGIRLKQLAYAPLNDLAHTANLPVETRAALIKAVQQTVSGWGSLARPIQEEKQEAKALLRRAFKDEIASRPKSDAFMSLVQTRSDALLDEYFGRLEAAVAEGSSVDPDSVQEDLDSAVEKIPFKREDARNWALLEKRYKKTPENLRAELVESIALLTIQLALPDAKQAKEINTAALEQYRALLASLQ